MTRICDVAVTSKIVINVTVATIWYILLLSLLLSFGYSSRYYSHLVTPLWSHRDRSLRRITNDVTVKPHVDSHVTISWRLYYGIIMTSQQLYDESPSDITMTSPGHFSQSNGHSDLIVESPNDGELTVIRWLDSDVTFYLVSELMDTSALQLRSDNQKMMQFELFLFPY